MLARLRRCNYLYEVLVGLYMLDAWERSVFNAIAIAVIAVGLYFLVPSVAALTS